MVKYVENAIKYEPASYALLLLVRLCVCVCFLSFRFLFCCVDDGDAGATAPRQLTWLIVGSNGVHLSWLPPAEPNGIITSYIISYCSDALELYTTTAGVCSTQNVHGQSLLVVLHGKLLLPRIG